MAAVVNALIHVLAYAKTFVRHHVLPTVLETARAPILEQHVRVVVLDAKLVVRQLVIKIVHLRFLLRLYHNYKYNEVI